jgi:hypothetical protein
LGHESGDHLRAATFVDEGPFGEMSLREGGTRAGVHGHLGVH